MTAPVRERAIEPKRLRRAATLIGDKIAPGQYAVRGVEEPVYWVDLSQEIPCMCLDSQHRGVQCKHMLYARMREGDEMVLLALGQMMLRDQEHLRDYLRLTRSTRRTNTYTRG